MTYSGPTYSNLRVTFASDTRLSLLIDETWDGTYEISVHWLKHPDYPAWTLVGADNLSSGFIDAGFADLAVIVHQALLEHLDSLPDPNQTGA